MVHEILQVAIYYSLQGQCGYMKIDQADMIVSMEKFALLFLQLVAELPLSVQQHRADLGPELLVRRFK